MAYEAPTAAEFKARFPEFAVVADALIDAAIAEAGEAVGDRWPDAGRLIGHRLYAAHILAVEGEPERSAEITAAAAAGETASHSARDVSSVRIGDTAWTYGNANGAKQYATSAPIVENLAATRYGRQFKEIRARYFVGITTV